MIFFPSPWFPSCCALFPCLLLLCFFLLFPEEATQRGTHSHVELSPNPHTLYVFPTLSPLLGFCASWWRKDARSHEPIGRANPQFLWNIVACFLKKNHTPCNTGY